MTLKKGDVEILLATYDADPVAAVENALRRLLRQPEASYDDMLRTLVEQGRLNEDRWQALTDRQLGALDLLAAELNETRTLRP
jgi:hypothetical protein